MVSLSNTCTVHFICQCFNLWSFLWLWLNAILLFISDKNFSAMSLEFLDFRVLIMNILCLFQCPCLTRTPLAFKSPLSDLSGKWCSHAMGLFCVFSTFSSRAEIKCMQSLWQISVLQHNFGFWWCLLLPTDISGQKEMKNDLSNMWHWVLWPGRHSSRCWSISLFFESLCKSSVFLAAPRHFPTGLSQAMSFCQKSLFSWISIFKLGRRNFDCFCSVWVDRLRAPGRGTLPITSSSVWAWEIHTNQLA